MLAADLVAATRRHLDGTQRPELNLLDGAVDRDVTTWTFANALGGIQAGSVNSCELEDVYIWAVDEDAKTASVLRGYGSSVQAAHADTELVQVNSRYTDWEIICRLNDDLSDLSAPSNGLYQVRTLDVTAVSGQDGYDFPVTGFLSLADVRWRDFGDVSKRWYTTAATVEYGVPLDQFPSGTALMVPGVPAEQTIRVRYRAALGALTSLSDDVAEQTGLPDTALDLPPLGAACAIMAGRPVGRAQYSTQGDTRRAGEVSTGDVLNAPAALRQLRAARLTAEASRLAQQWPASVIRVHL